MSIVVLFIVLAVRQLDFSWPSGWVEPNRVGRKMHPLVQWAARKKWPDSGTWLLAVALPVLLWSLLQSWVNPLLGGILDGALLLWLLGAESEFRYLDGLVQRARMRDVKQFSAQAEMRFGVSGNTAEEGSVNTLMRRILLFGAEGVFAILFWTFILGYWAALLYVLNYTLAKKQPKQSLAVFLHAALSWLPNRLLVVAMALAGSFRGATEASADYWWELSNGKQLLAATIPDALDLAAPTSNMIQLDEAATKLVALQKILHRCLALWLIVGVLWWIIMG